MSLIFPIKRKQSKMKSVIQNGNDAEEAWDKLRSDTYFNKENKSILNIKSFKIIEKPFEINFLGIGKLIDKSNYFLEEGVASCYEESEGEYVFCWLE